MLQSPDKRVSVGVVLRLHAFYILICDAVERGIIVEAKVTSVYDVVRLGIACKLIQLAEVS